MSMTAALTPSCASFCAAFQRFRHHDAVGNQRNIVAVAQHVAFADGEGGARLVDARRLLTNGAHPVEAFAGR